MLTGFQEWIFITIHFKHFKLIFMFNLKHFRNISFLFIMVICIHGYHQNLVVLVRMQSLNPPRVIHVLYACHHRYVFSINFSDPRSTTYLVPTNKTFIL